MAEEVKEKKKKERGRTIEKRKGRSAIKRSKIKNKNN